MSQEYLFRFDVETASKVARGLAQLQALPTAEVSSIYRSRTLWHFWRTAGKNVRTYSESVPSEQITYSIRADNDR